MHRPRPFVAGRAGLSKPSGLPVTQMDVLERRRGRPDFVEAGGEEGIEIGFLGFSQALFLAGARSLVLSLWEVDDTATALLMKRFYENLLGRRPGLNRPLSKVEALQEAKHWLRCLTDEEVAQLQGQFPKEARSQIHQGGVSASPASGHPFEHPYYWSAFILIGEPGDEPPEGDREIRDAARATAVGEPLPTLAWLVVALLGLAVIQVVRCRAARPASKSARQPRPAP